MEYRNIEISSGKYRLGFEFQTGIVFAFNDSRRFQHVPNKKETIYDRTSFQNNEIHVIESNNIQEKNAKERMEERR